MQKIYQKNIIVSIVISYLFCFFLQCSIPRNRTPATIRLKGSDTMYILASQWAEKYMKLNSNVSIYVEGGGTARGVQALIRGKADICMASRPLLPSEVKRLAEKTGTLGIGFLIAKDALSIYLNPTNPVQNLSIDEIRKIFLGKITNWSQLNGIDEPIKIIIRPPNSGTHLYVKEHLLQGKSYGATAVMLPTTNSIVDAIIENRGAIGYGGIAYGSKIVHCKINGVEPTMENVQNDSYPIIRYLYLYTANTPQGAIKNFIDWALKNGQSIVEETGYIPLWK